MTGRSPGEEVHRQIDRLLDEAYAAGVLDALGSWRATWRGTPGRPQKKGQYAPRVVCRPRRIDQLAVLEQLQQIFGGSISKPKFRQAGMRRPEWSVSGAKACVAVTEAVLPYLVFRQRRARAHLALCRRIVEYKRAGFHERGLPEQEAEDRHVLYVTFQRTPT